MDIEYRLAAEPDMVLVVESFLESYRDAHAAGLIQMEDWFDVMRPQWRKVLARPGVEVFVACWKGERDHVADLAGWIVVERGYQVPERVRANGRWVKRMEPQAQPLVHYVLVKQPYRRHGIARGLFHAAGVNPAAGFNYTCKTAIVTTVAAKIPAARWVPMVARFPK